MIFKLDHVDFQPDLKKSYWKHSKDLINKWKIPMNEKLKIRNKSHFVLFANIYKQQYLVSLL